MNDPHREPFSTKLPRRLVEPATSHTENMQALIRMSRGYSRFPEVMEKFASLLIALECVDPAKPPEEGGRQWIA